MYLKTKQKKIIIKFVKKKIKKNHDKKRILFIHVGCKNEWTQVPQKKSTVISHTHIYMH